MRREARDENSSLLAPRPTLLLGLNMDTLYWLINTQTLGGLVAMAVFGTVVTLYFLMMRWIVAGAHVADDGDSS